MHHYVRHQAKYLQSAEGIKEAFLNVFDFSSIFVLIFSTLVSINRLCAKDNVMQMKYCGHFMSTNLDYIKQVLFSVSQS